MRDYLCKKCGWSGQVKDKAYRCLGCAREAVRKWRKENPEKYKIQRARKEKRFRTERRDEYNAKRRRIRSSERNAEQRIRRLKWFLEGNVTRLDLVEIFEKQKGKCSYCGTLVKPRFTPSDPRGFDHIIPRKLGGKHEKDNIQVCCGKCNGIKSDKIINPNSIAKAEGRA